jgi:hypothetical protein
LIPKPYRIVGVDLGQARDWTAISVIERHHVPSAPAFNEEHRTANGLPTLRARQPLAVEYHLRHLERPALGTPYPDVVARIVALVKALGGEMGVVLDATGVGRPVAEMLWRELAGGLDGTDTRVRPCSVTITGGDSVTRVPGGYRVPKRDLVTCPLVLMQSKRLKVAEGLALKNTFVRELLAFRLKINISTGHDSYEAWREGDHDDLVLSVALACWAGERFIRTHESTVLEGQVVQDAPVFVMGHRRR